MLYIEVLRSNKKNGAVSQIRKFLFFQERKYEILKCRNVVDENEIIEMINEHEIYKD